MSARFTLIEAIKNDSKHPWSHFNRQGEYDSPTLNNGGFNQFASSRKDTSKNSLILRYRK